MSKGIAENHAEVAALSTNSRHTVVPNAGRNPPLCAAGCHSSDSGCLHGVATTKQIAAAFVMATKRPDQELLLRITVDHPPPGVRFQLQRGAKDLVPAARTTRMSLTFEFPLRVGERPTGDPNFLGPFTQGPPHGRFVYINSGTLAGQADSCWTRRAKIPLTSITWALIDRAVKPPWLWRPRLPASVAAMAVLSVGRFRYAMAAGESRV